MHLILRGSWRALPPRSRTRYVDVDGFTLHYSGMLSDARASHEHCGFVMRAFQRAHMAPGGLGAPEGGADIAYNFVGCPHGHVFEGRGWRFQTGANGSREANRHFLAYCVMGGDRAGRQDVTDDAREALLAFAARFSEVYPDANEVWPHSHFRNTSCPGDELRAMIPELRSIVAPR